MKRDHRLAPPRWVVEGPPYVCGGLLTWPYAARAPRSLRRATTTPVVGGVKWEGGSCVARCPRPADVGPIRCDCMYRSRNTTRQPVRPLTGGGIWLRARRNRTFTMCGGVALRGGVAKQKDRCVRVDLQNWGVIVVLICSARQGGSGSVSRFGDRAIAPGSPEKPRMPHTRNLKTFEDRRFRQKSYGELIQPVDTRKFSITSFV